MIEVHCNPQEALSDKDQALLPDTFGQIVPKIRSLVGFMDVLRDNTNPNQVGEEARDDLRVAC
jgi:hypothetical protein